MYLRSRLYRKVVESHVLYLIVSIAENHHALVYIWSTSGISLPQQILRAGGKVFLHRYPLEGRDVIGGGVPPTDMVIG